MYIWEQIQYFGLFVFTSRKVYNLDWVKVITSAEKFHQSFFLNDLNWKITSQINLCSLKKLFAQIAGRKSTSHCVYNKTGRGHHKIKILIIMTWSLARAISLFWVSLCSLFHLCVIFFAFICESVFYIRAAHIISSAAAASIIHTSSLTNACAVPLMPWRRVW